MCGPSPIPVVTSHGGWNRITTTLLKAPANPAERSSPRTLLLPRLPCQQPLRSLPPCGPSVSEPRAPAQHSSEVLRELPSRAGLTVTLWGTVQKGRLSPGETQTPTPVPPQPRVPVALEPQGPVSLLTCFFLSSYYHTQLFPRRTVGTAMSLGKAWSPEHQLLTPRTAQAFALWRLYSAGSWHFNCLLLSLTSCPCNLWWFSSGFPGSSDRKESACHARDPGSISGSGRFPGEGNGSLLQYSCLENSMDRGAWRTTVHGVMNWTWLSD